MKSKRVKKRSRLTVLLQTEVEHQPDRIKLSLDDFPDGEKWKNMRSQLDHCVSLSIEDPPIKLILDANPLFFQHSREQIAPQFGFFCTLENTPKDQIEDIETWLISWFDELMTHGIGAQAMVGRWNWRGGRYTLNWTPYELAVGSHGQCTTAGSGCRKFLRGVTGEMWLGAD